MNGKREQRESIWFLGKIKKAVKPITKTFQNYQIEEMILKI